jgi:hypothetical protein
MELLTADPNLSPVQGRNEDVPGVARTADVAGMALEVLEAVICRGAADLAAAERDWLTAVAEFDRREGWRSWGCASCAAWLSWHASLDIRAAREKVRVARILTDFPLIAAAMGRGELSYSKVRAITRIVRAEAEAALVEMALAGTTNHVERIVSAYRRCEQTAADTDRQQHERRTLHHAIDDDGSIVITIRLPAESGLAVLSAVEQFVSDERPAPGDPVEPLPVRRADAIVALAHAASGSGAGGGRRGASPYLVTLHVEPEALTEPGGSGRCEVVGSGDAVDHPIGVSAATAMRVCCDAEVETYVADPAGTPLFMGRRTRLVRGLLRRAVEARDGRCRFPGCSRRGRVDAHHAVHWLHGGRTDLDNVLLLCPFHHRAMHEGGWEVRPHAEDGFVFRSPDGRVVDDAPRRFAGTAANVQHCADTDDGRSRWAGDRLDLDLALTALFSRLPRTPPGSGRLN